MKNKWFHITKRLLTLAIAFSWIISSKWASLFMFGEYPYPTEEQ